MYMETEVPGSIPITFPKIQSLILIEVTDITQWNRLLGIIGVILISTISLSPLCFSPISIALNSFILLVRCFLINSRKNSLPSINPKHPPRVVKATTKLKVKKQPQVLPKNRPKIMEPARTRKEVGIDKSMKTMKRLMQRNTPEQKFASNQMKKGSKSANRLSKYLKKRQLRVALYDYLVKSYHKEKNSNKNQNTFFIAPYQSW